MSGAELLLDTNVLIGLLKEHPAALALLQQEGLDQRLQQAADGLRSDRSQTQP